MILIGYYTSYTLTAQAETIDQSLLDRLKESLKNANILKYALDDCWTEIENHPNYQEVFFDTYDDAKWYSHSDDMKAISEAYPELTFCLHGEGESRDDTWDEYWQAGKSELCSYHWTADQPSNILWR